MKTNRLHTVFFLLGSALLFGCSISPTQFHGPDAFASSAEVFAGSSANSVPTGGPADSRLAKNYGVPFYDALREAQVAATQAQFFIENIDESSGLIFASQSTPIQRGMGVYVDPGMKGSGFVESEKRFFLIAVEELDGNSVTVSITNKVQYECRGQDGPFHSSALCQSLTEVQWPTGAMKNITALETFHNFLTNNLMAAGLL